MDLNTVEEVLRPTSRSQIASFEAGDAWLAGGTWLFSEPQRHLRRLIDLTALNWPALEADDDGLRIGATCPVATLEAFEPPVAWRAGPLIQACCRAYWASFKIWTTATVGGNLCLGLPAGPMISLAAALEGNCLIWTPGGGERRLAAADFVLGPQQNALRPGELLRRIDIPAQAFRHRAAFRQTSLTPVGRSAALVIGTLSDAGALRITVTAATPQPVILNFETMPDAALLRATLDDRVPAASYFDDLHGAPDWRQHLTRQFVEDVRAELAA